MKNDKKMTDDDDKKFITKRDGQIVPLGDAEEDSGINSKRSVESRSDSSKDNDKITDVPVSDQYEELNEKWIFTVRRDKLKAELQKLIGLIGFNRTDEEVNREFRSVKKFISKSDKTTDMPVSDQYEEINEKWIFTVRRDKLKAELQNLISLMRLDRIEEEVEREFRSVMKFLSKL